MASGHCCVDNFGRHCDPKYLSYRRPGEGRDPVTEPIRLDPGLRRDDDSVDIRYPLNNAGPQ
jgi:hypothetical protein